MHRLVNEFKHLSLAQQHEVFPEIFAAYNAAKEARRQELEAEIKSLGFKPGEAKKSPTVAAKYRSRRDPSKTWGGRGAIASWLKAEMAETGNTRRLQGSRLREHVFVRHVFGGFLFR